MEWYEYTYNAYSIILKMYEDDVTISIEYNRPYSCQKVFIS